MRRTTRRPAVPVGHGRMFTCSALLLAFLSVLSTAGPVKGQWERACGIGEVSVSSFAATRSCILARSQDSIIRSTDEGNTWSEATAGVQWTQVFTIISNDPDFYLGTDSGVFRTSDDGRTWNKLSGGLPPPPNVVAIVADDSGLIAGNGWTLYRYSFKTNLWQPFDSSALTGRGIVELMIHGQTYYAATHRGIYRSNDGGRSWVLKRTGLLQDYDADVNTIVFDGGNILIGTQSGVFFSSDSGEHWAARSTGLSGSGIWSITRCGGTLIAAGGRDLCSSIDSGLHWQPIMPGSSFAAGVFMLFLHNGSLLAGSTFGVLLSTDCGESWRGTNTGLPTQSANSFGVLDSFLYVVASNASVLRSSDNGGHWQSVSAGLAQTTINTLTVVGETIILGTNNRIFLSNDRGAHWDSSDAGLPQFARVYALAAFDSIVFAGMNTAPYRSTDYGKSWTDVSGGINMGYIHAFARQGHLIYVGTLSTGMFLSSDDGLHWHPTPGSIPSTDPVTDFLVDGTTVYAATSGSYIFVTHDSGATWSALDSGLTDRYVFALSKAGNSLFTATRSNVFRSTDNGAHWTPTDLKREADTFGKTKDYLFAGTRIDGPWRYPIASLNAVPCETIARNAGPISIVPNPATSRTAIHFRCERADRLRIRILDVLGHEIAVLHDGYEAQGEHTVEWLSGGVPSGTYICVVDDDTQSQEAIIQVVAR